MATLDIPASHRSHFNPLCSFYKAYSRRLPSSINWTVIKSFGLSCMTVTLLSLGNLKKGFIIGGIAAIAALIDSLIIAPLFKELFGVAGQGGTQEVIRTIINISFSTFMCSFSPYRLNLIASTALSLFPVGWNLKNDSVNSRRPNSLTCFLYA